MATVTIKGVFQMNGPKPFQRIIECSQSEVGYYTHRAETQFICRESYYP